MKSLRTLLFALPVLLAFLALDARAQQAVTFPSGDSTAQGCSTCPRAPARIRP
jgi:hypothetical protein